MNLIELHIIQSFPVTCLNRDDIGAPKSAIFGGVQRARVSSQCWKRAIRMLAREEYIPESFAGSRTHFIADQLARALEKKGIKQDISQKISSDIATQIGNQNNDFKDGHKTQVALYFSPDEINAIAQGIADEYESQKEMKKVDIKKYLKKYQPKDIADIALFGRMVANDPSLTLEAAAMVTHALSTHKVSNDIDFFSAVDDKKPEHTEGAGHIGTLEYNSACYYRYIGINLDLLTDEDHLGHLGKDEVNKILKQFIKASILAVPGARKNSMFGFNPPEYVLGLRRSGQPISLVNAFEKPIKGRDGYVETSVKNLEEKFNHLFETYSLNKGTEARIPEGNINDFLETLTKNSN